MPVVPSVPAIDDSQKQSLPRRASRSYTPDLPANPSARRPTHGQVSQSHTCGPHSEKTAHNLCRLDVPARASHNGFERLNNLDRVPSYLLRTHQRDRKSTRLNSSHGYIS